MEIQMNRLPAGPRSTVVLAARYLHDACAYYARCESRYGDPFTLPTPFGPLVVTGAPEGIQTIYTADPDTFDIFAKSSVEPFLGASSLMLSTGETHSRNRRLLLPRFHGRHIDQFAAAMAEAAARAMARWRPGKSFVAQDEMHHISLDIILKVFFGAKAEILAPIEDALLIAQQSITPAITFLPCIRHQFAGLGPWARFRRAMENFDRVIFQMIREARLQPSEDNILGLLLTARYEDGEGLSDVAVRDEIVSLVAAGHETLASALAWALYWLHREPAALTRLREETADVGTNFERLFALPYMDAVCNETLRLCPILPEVTRLLRRPLKLLGYTLPAGVGVASVATLVHMREDLYPQAHEFRPERFLSRKYSPFEFVPFGGGTHRCLGASFAIFEMKIVLAKILRDCRLRLLTPGPIRPRRRSVPFGPQRGVVFMVEEEYSRA
ncbi:MAG: cytochrome [Bryobacterales bacterium]|nr:cytochrome [Bryobacterales bacterium]